MNVGDKVKLKNLRAKVMLIVYPTMHALVVMERNGSRRLVDLSEWTLVEEGAK